jgi:spore maturation protein CgeB
MRALGRLVRGRAVREFNEELLRAARRTRPELLLAFKGTFVRAHTLHALRERGIRSYCFSPDVSARTHGAYLPDALAAYDLVLTTKRFGLTDLAALGVQRVELLHHAFDPDLHRPVPLSADDLERYGCAVSFIGTWSPKKERYLRALRQARPEIAMRIWGAQWDRARSRELRDVIARHTVDGEEYVRAIRASTINIALLSERRSGASAGDQVTSRTFHIPAAGGFMLHERTSELLALLREGDEVACFDGEAELTESVGRWLANPAGRERIAHAGSDTVRQAHGWDTRVQELLGHLPASRAGRG